LVKTLLFRAKNLTSDNDAFLKELKFIEFQLINNGYPPSFINTIKSSFIKEMNKTKPVFLTADKLDIVLKLPYIGWYSQTLKKKLLKLFDQHFPQVCVKVIFTPVLKLENFLRFKDKIPRCSESSLVYKYNCGCCNASYVGQTTRHLLVRIAEHKGISFRTNMKITNPGQSMIREHFPQDRAQ
jgi:hypothetical protein